MITVWGWSHVQRIDAMWANFLNFSCMYVVSPATLCLVHCLALCFGVLLCPALVLVVFAFFCLVFSCSLKLCLVWEARYSYLMFNAQSTAMVMSDWNSSHHSTGKIMEHHMSRSYVTLCWKRTGGENKIESTCEAEMSQNFRQQTKHPNVPILCALQSLKNEFLIPLH